MTRLIRTDSGRGRKGDAGSPGAPGGSDAAFAALIADPGSLSHAAGVAAFGADVNSNASIVGKSAAAYNAVGNGISDDWDELQTMIAASVNAYSGGAGAWIGPGLYDISQPLVCPSGQGIFAAGMSNTIIRAKAGSVMEAMIITEEDQLNWAMTLADFQLDANRDGGALVDHAIKWFGASDSSMRSLRIRDIAGDGILITGDGTYLGTAVTLDDVRVRGCDGVGILNDVFSTDTSLVNCDVGQCDDHAIYMGGSNSSVEATRGWGSLTGMFAAGQILRIGGGSRFDFNQLNGIHVTGDRVQFSGVQVHSNSVADEGVYAGIEVADGAGKVQFAATESFNSAIPGAGVQSYGLKLGAGRTGPAIIASGCDFSGNDLGDIDGLDVGDILGVADSDLFAVLAESGSDSRGEVEGIAQFYANNTKISATAVLNFGSVGSWGEAEMTMEVVGAVVGDAVTLGPPAGIETGLIWSAYVSSVDEVTLRLSNHTAGAIDPASATWRATVSH